MKMPPINDRGDVIALAMTIFIAIISVGFILAFISGAFFNSDNENEDDTRRNYGE